MSMAAVPIKPEFGPTLGRLLSPSWRAAPAIFRISVIAVVAVLLAVAVAFALTFENAHYSHSGNDPFHFAYRDLHRTTPEAGGFVRVVQRDGDGRLRYSYEVDPLSLPAYRGGVSGELPVFATGYAAQLARRFEGYVARGEGKTRVNGVPGYELLFTAEVEGREVLGRDVLLTPAREGARIGVSIVMLSSVTASKQITAPIEVASEGVLLRPLKTFSFG
jgi:hypothetical protein